MSFIRSETDLWIIIYYLAEIFCILLILSQIVGLCYNSSRLNALNHESWVSKQGATRNILIALFTTYSCSAIGIAVVISRIGNHLYDPIHCDYTYMISFMLFATAKLCNYYFSLQRAKLAQGLNKMLPELAFERIFPIVFVLLYIMYIILIILIPIRGDRVISPNTGRTLCKWAPPDIEHEIIFILSTIFDVFMTIFLLYLYGKPLCEIVQHSSKTSNTNEAKLRRCIMVNFICSSVSSVHTAIVALTWYNISFMAWWSIMDYVVNCLCLFLMFASNRRLLLHCFCCYYKRKGTIYTLHQQQQQQQVKGNNISLQIPRSSAVDLPSIHTVSDFPQPRGILNHDADPPVIPPISQISNESHYKDIAERNGFISQNGVNYFKYLNQNCCYYKSKLFWTWFAYYFCFCGNKSLCKCYCCVCDQQMCKKRSKKRNHILKYMFGAAKKIQYMRYYERLKNEHSKKSANNMLGKPSPKGQRSLSGIQEIEPSDDDTNNIPNNVARYTSNSDFRNE